MDKNREGEWVAPQASEQNPDIPIWPKNVAEIGGEQFITAVKAELYESLSACATEIILSPGYQHPEDPFRSEFANNPDSIHMHSKWHEWDIVKHSEMMGPYLENKVPVLLKQWYGEEEGGNMLGLDDEYIDGISKGQLLRLAPPIHDYGKFRMRQFWFDEETGEPLFAFQDHEEASGAIVREWRDRFRGFGFTDKHIDYLADCAEVHYKLGRLRILAKQTTEGYSIAFTKSETFRTEALKIARENPNMAREIGVMFAADSLAKTGIHVTATAQSDEAIAAKRSMVEAEIARRQLPSHLVGAAMQMGINMACAREFMQTTVIEPKKNLPYKQKV